MKNEQNFLYAQDAETLQVPYADYIGLMEKVEEAQCLLQVKMTVLTDLQRFTGNTPATPPVAPKANAAPKTSPTPIPEPPVPAKEQVPEKISVEFSADTPGDQTPQDPALRNCGQWAWVCCSPPRATPGSP